MPTVLSRLLLLAFMLIAGAAHAADVKPYVREDLASDVVRLAETLRKETAQIGAQIRGRSADQLRKDAAAAIVTKSFKDASAYLSAAEYLRQASFSTATSWTGASLVARGSGWPDSPRSCTWRASIRPRPTSVNRSCCLRLPRC